MRRLKLALLSAVVTFGLGTGIATANPIQQDDTDSVTVDVGATTSGEQPCKDDPKTAKNDCCKYEPGSVDDRYVTPIEKASGLSLCERERLTCVAVQIINVGACADYPTGPFYGQIAEKLGWK